MNFLHQGFRKLSSDRQTDRHDRNYILRRFAGGQKSDDNNGKVNADFQISETRLSTSLFKTTTTFSEVHLLLYNISINSSSSSSSSCLIDNIRRHTRATPTYKCSPVRSVFLSTSIALGISLTTT